MFVDRARAEIEDLADVAVRFAASNPRQDQGFAIGDLQTIAQRRLDVACATPSPRSFDAMPALATMDANRRLALSTNERASHEPVSSKSERARRLHPSNCACCKPGGKSRATVFRADGAKSFPSARPWMISH